MPTDVGSARAITLRLVNQARTNGDAAPRESLPIVVACERTCRELSTRLGSAGVHALLTRALSRAQAEHPFLIEIIIGRYPEASLGGVEGIIHRHGARAAAAGIEATLASMLELLGDLIGIDVVARLLSPHIGADAHHEVTTHRGTTVGLQNEVAERLLLRIFLDQNAAVLAETLRRDAAFLASEGRRLAESLDERATLSAMARMSLPDSGGWCIVDVLDEFDAMTRVPIVHPDEPTQAMLDALDGRWLPFPGDSFGLPAALAHERSSVIVAADVRASLVASAREPNVSRALSTIATGAMITVPLVTRRRLVGAITFVSGRRDRAFTMDDLELAEDLASRSATALDRARAYGQAVTLKETAVSANDAKTTFLGMMSHELRTPLNAIGGYVELMALEIHGPITAEQRMDLTRIRTNQRYLMGLISDLLNLTAVGTGHLIYDIVDLVAHEVLTSSIALVHPLIAQKGLSFEGFPTDMSILARGDHEKVIQILVNLLSNAIKFTPAGGELVIEYLAKKDVVQLRVCDTGIGIPAEKLDVIFDPFVQVRSSTAEQRGGIGLGLAISRGLARGMNGDLTVESTIDKGARFTLTLPRQAGAAPLATGS